tara:strand:+ start:1688 stop:2554 length:867 start_codon:yes stop_codon:yes gene_type:complete
MNIEYLNFRGFNTTSNVKATFTDPGKGEFEKVEDMYYGIENTRTLTVNKSDVMSIYSYIPETVNLGAGECSGCNVCLSYRVVLGLKNQGYLELNIVSDVPVNNVQELGPGQLGTLSTDSGLRALTVPFNSWVLNNNVSEDSTCGGQMTNAIFEIQSPVALLDGKQYQWTPEAIKAYFGVLNSDGNFATSVRELVSRWLEEKVSNYLIANPGTPLTDVVLGEVKDYTYEGVTYGGFKLRFGGIGIPKPFFSLDKNQYVFSQNVATAYPFRWSDTYVVSTSAGGPPGGEA